MEFLPASNRETPPVLPTEDPIRRREMSLDTLVPANPNLPYDMKELIGTVVDEGDFFDLQPNSEGNIITDFGRMDGSTLGFVANQHMVQNGRAWCRESERQD